MEKRVLAASVLFALFSCTILTAQTYVNSCPYSRNHWNDLACLIPTVTRTGQSNNLGPFNTTLGEVISQLPLASPVSGFTLALDKTLGIYVATNENLGSVLTERGDTIGRHKLFVGFTVQRFVFQSINGTDLKNIPIVYKIDQRGTFGAATDGIGANINQFTAIAAFGLTDRIDVALTLPFERVSLSSAQSSGLQAAPGCDNKGVPSCRASTTSPESAAGSASGPGDLILNAKATVVKGERWRLAAGAELRFPTGDEFNLLGSGAFGVKPYVVISRRGRIQPHANFGYQWNSFSPLYLSADGANLRLPDSLEYSAGADVGVAKRVTFVGDFVGQHFFDAPRVTRAAPATDQNVPGLPPALLQQMPGLSTVGVERASFDEDNLSLGLKINPFGRLLVSANVLIKLNDAGLRANYVPLVGVSYRF